MKMICLVAPLRSCRSTLGFLICVVLARFFSTASSSAEGVVCVPRKLKSSGQATPSSGDVGDPFRDVDGEDEVDGSSARVLRKSLTRVARRLQSTRRLDLPASAQLATRLHLPSARSFGVGPRHVGNRNNKNRRTPEDHDNGSGSDRDINILHEDHQGGVDVLRTRNKWRSTPVAVANPGDIGARVRDADRDGSSVQVLKKSFSRFAQRVQQSFVVNEQENVIDGGGNKEDQKIQQEEAAQDEAGDEAMPILLGQQKDHEDDRNKALGPQVDEQEQELQFLQTPRINTGVKKIRTAALLAHQSMRTLGKSVNKMKLRTCGGRLDESDIDRLWARLYLEESRPPVSFSMKTTSTNIRYSRQKTKVSRNRNQENLASNNIRPEHPRESIQSSTFRFTSEGRNAAWELVQDAWQEAKGESNLELRRFNEFSQRWQFENRGIMWRKTKDGWTNGCGGMQDGTVAGLLKMHAGDEINGVPGATGPHLRPTKKQIRVWITEQFLVTQRRD